MLPACDDRRQMLTDLFEAAIATARPERCVPPHLPPRPAGRLIVIGAGKASAAMAKAVEDHWEGPLEGAVVTRYGYGVATRRIAVLEAAHPVPDAAGEAAARRIMALARSAGPDDLVLFLLSGGGSALMAAPAAGLALSDKQALTKALLASGATIHEINCVRKHLSAVKGGRLAAAAHPARILTLAISGRAGRRPGRHRLGTDGRRPDNHRRRAGDPRALRHRAPRGGGRATLRRRRTNRPNPATRGWRRRITA